jgi:spore germination protein GerM
MMKKARLVLAPRKRGVLWPAPSFLAVLGAGIFLMCLLIPHKNVSGNQHSRYETLPIKVFFLNDRLDPEISCDKVFPVTRTIKKTKAVARAAVEELLQGPNEAEKTEGYRTSINEGVKIHRLTIQNGVARIDFNDILDFRVAGSCRVRSIRAQIEQTLKQFPSVREVTISVDGKTEDILQP